MCRSSAPVTRECCCGRRYNASQSASHTKPVTPVSTNAHCQPSCKLTHVTIGTEMTRPADTPALHRPVASPRSRRGNHSETALTHADQLPASPAPRRNLQDAKGVNVLMKA